MRTFLRVIGDFLFAFLVGFGRDKESRSQNGKNTERQAEPR